MSAALRPPWLVGAAASAYDGRPAGKERPGTAEAREPTP